MNEVEAEQQCQTDSFAANVFLVGDHFRTRGIYYHKDQVTGNGPRGSKMARHTAVFDPGGPLSGGSVIGVTDHNVFVPLLQCLDLIMHGSAYTNDHFPQLLFNLLE